MTIANFNTETETLTIINGDFAANFKARKLAGKMAWQISGKAETHILYIDRIGRDAGIANVQVWNGGESQVVGIKTRQNPRLTDMLGGVEALKTAALHLHSHV